MGQLMPFGRYKGQPVEALIHDRAYCEWLIQQPWFLEKFAHLHTVIINNHGEPVETPEHNQMQALFTDPEFRRRYLEEVYAAELADDEAVEVEFELAGADVALFWDQECAGCLKSAYVECKPTVGDDYPAILRAIDQTRERLRQRLHNHSFIYARASLLIGFGGYTGSVPSSQMHDIFSSRKVTVAYLDDLMPMVEGDFVLAPPA